MPGPGRIPMGFFLGGGMGNYLPSRVVVEESFLGSRAVCHGEIDRLCHKY